MSKYQPLNEFLRRSGERVPMTFAEIERILKSKLPPSKAHRAWWSNNPNNNVMTKEWLSAGFQTEAVDIVGEKLVFRRVHVSNRDTGAFSEFAEKRATRPLHPGFGFMEGLIGIEPGFDVTRPFSDEAWDAGYLGDNAFSSQTRSGTGS